MRDSDPAAGSDARGGPGDSHAPLPPSPHRLPVLGHTHRYARDPFEFVDWATDAAGDCLRARVLGAGELCVLAHPDHVQRALVDEREAFAKDDDFAVAFGEGLVAVDGDQWTRQHDAMREFFYPERIRGYAEQMVELTERRIDRWSDGDRVSLHREMRAVALENLFGTLFDRELAVGGDEALRTAAADLNEWFRPTSWVLPTWVPTPARRRFRRAVSTLESEAERLLAERRTAVEGKGPADGERAAGDDLLSALVEHRTNGDDGLDHAEIVDQVISFIFAGHDTTALALTYAWHLLGTHPDVRGRFHAELDEVLGGDDAGDQTELENGGSARSRPTMADVSDLAVTERVLLETLRLYPPIHTIPRTTTRPVVVDGYRIPADTTTHLSVVSIHRDERFYDDPDAFRPSRWRDQSPQSKGHAFVPFGAGPRDCIGRRFAMLEATLVLATVGRRFRFEPRSEIALDPQMTTQPADGVPARVVER